ncbi:hypothetical protein [Owenweeksia hongkongensis]|uniref:hypothetical protein n=1 Tax=Owenweeksia hongkongensis TaxID=253245 RepID=UPI003A946944
MTNRQKDPLFILVKSLSKSEKRQFRLYANRLDVNAEAKFMALFNHLDRANDYDEEAILNTGIVKKQQVSNLKAHLYRQILISLRLSPSHQNIRIHLREQLDFATILYQKGLYKQSLKLLEKAKQQAIENEEKTIAFEIVEFEKIIESQYITRSISGRADELSIQAKDLSRLNIVASKLSNLSLQLYGTMLKSGYVKNDAEMQHVTGYFNARMPEVDLQQLGFREKLWLYKANLWHSFLTQNFLSSYKNATRWVELFYSEPKMITQNPVWFLKGNHYLLESLFLMRYYAKFKTALHNLEKTVSEKSFPKNENTQSLAFLYVYINKINLHFLDGSFAEGVYLVPEINKKIAKHEDRLDHHHVMLFYYKIACLYFGMGNNLNCIVYLQKIIHNKNLSMREDLMCFARVLNLVAHYEAGLDEDFERNLKSTYKFLIKMNDLHEVQREMIRFLRNLDLGNVYPHQLKAEFKKLHGRLKLYEEHPYEKRAFLYLDIISWLESKIENRPVGDIVTEKAKLLGRWKKVAN